MFVFGGFEEGVSNNCVYVTIHNGDFLVSTGQVKLNIVGESQEKSRKSGEVLLTEISFNLVGSRDQKLAFYSFYLIIW